jgi:hypothetical protein
MAWTTTLPLNIEDPGDPQRGTEPSTLFIASAGCDGKWLVSDDNQYIINCDHGLDPDNKPVDTTSLTQTALSYYNENGDNWQLCGPRRTDCQGGFFLYDNSDHAFQCNIIQDQSGKFTPVIMDSREDLLKYCDNRTIPKGQEGLMLNLPRDCSEIKDGERCLAKDSQGRDALKTCYTDKNNPDHHYCGDASGPPPLPPLAPSSSIQKASMRRM